MTAPFRVPGRGVVDPSRELSFTFDGKSYVGLAGDTLASALLANGVRLVARSFKYHRPRGFMSAGNDEPNGIVSIDRGAGRFTPNVRATTAELYDGMIAHSQNRWPSLRWDLGQLTELAAPLLPAGFYYKTFMFPRPAWHHLYEPVIRALAGLGDAPTEPDMDRYATQYAHCETLVVGAGVAGIAAALAAALNGDRVILCDENADAGGHMLSVPDAVVEGVSARDWVQQSMAQLAAMPNVRILTRATAFGIYDRSMTAIVERRSDHLAPGAQPGPRERLWRVRARHTVLATGAYERPLVFPDNDRPGIMLADAARTYLHRYGVLVGRSPIVVTSDDRAYAVAVELAQAGAQVQAIIDTRSIVSARCQEAARSAGISIINGGAILGVLGRNRVRAIMINDGQGNKRTIGCDAVLVSNGWTPSVHLYSHARGSLVWSADHFAFLPVNDVDSVTCVGACKGTDHVDAAIAEARNAGMYGQAAPDRAHQAGRQGVGPSESAIMASVTSKGRAFVDFQHDVMAKDIRLAIREGFHSIEHIKRYTTTGMATDQGKTSNMNALAIASDILNRPLPDVGLTKFRPPFTPVSFGTLASRDPGETFDPLRRSALDAWAETQGAVFEPVGQWRRALYFPQAGEDMDAAVRRECAAVRNGVGIFDASTLGKIEMVGPDAAEFLDRLYTNAWGKLAPGRCKYGVMLGEDGYIMDDGVIARLAENRFHVTTTTGGAARVLAHMEEYLQVHFRDLTVWLTSTTEQWAVIAIQGPLARKVVAPLFPDLDLSNEHFPHMSVCETELAGFPVRLFRVSFTGEMGYEINVPASKANQVWDALLELGRTHGITPYGTETMHVLRAEKGYIIVGQETDGTVTPGDVGLGWAIAKSKPDFVGKRSLQQSGLMAKDRRQLVGLLTSGHELLEVGAQLVADAGQVQPGCSVGWVTSAYDSPAAGRPIALALLQDGRSRMGEMVHVSTDKGFVPAQVTGTVFHDVEGARLHG